MLKHAVVSRSNKPTPPAALHRNSASSQFIGLPTCIGDDLSIQLGLDVSVQGRPGNHSFLNRLACGGELTETGRTHAIVVASAKL